jgi:hypothetical protein
MPPSKIRDFKKCDCGSSWKTRDDFFGDGKVKIVGYQPDLVNHKYNHFVFFHRTKECGQFFGIRASHFSDLRNGECPKELGMGMEECPGYCTDTLDLRICSVACRNATDREVAARISKRRLLRSMGPTGNGPTATAGETKKSTKKKHQRKTATTR